MTALATEDTEAPLDYDALYARYLAALVDDLRGFRAAAPGLELWVPDEDPLTSLRNLLDAATTVGRARVAVRLSGATLRALGGDLSRLVAMAEPYGEARVSSDGDGAVLEVRALDAPVSRRAEARPPAAAASGPRSAVETPARAAPARPGPPREATLEPYRPALERAAASPRFRGGALPDAPGRSTARAARDGAALWLGVDVEHRVVAASFDAEDPLRVGLLESLCHVLIGLPLLEGAEHGTSRLERRLRGAAPRPVPGIVLPESAHPLLGWARRLLADALDDHRRQTGFAEVHSRHDPRPGEAWLRASDAERRERLAEALGRALAARGLAPRSARVESIRHDVRVELSLELPAQVDGPALVMDLERALAADVDPRLEVYVTERRDRNAKRRLAVLGEDT